MALLVLAVLSLLFFPKSILAVPYDDASADILVVPGGDGEPRAQLAAQLWHQGRAPLILLTGDGDCYANKLTLLLAGVPEQAIRVECLSGSTWQNALYSAPVLRALAVRNAIIVTNWFHARRALLSFRTACPQMHFNVAGLGTAGLPGRALTDSENIHVTREYVKLAGYILLGRASLSSIFSAGPDQQSSAPCDRRGAVT